VTKPVESLFITQDELAARLGVSRNAIIAAIGRGEIAGVQHVGSRVLIAWPAWQLKALGVSDVGTFCKSLGVKNMGALIAFLCEDGDGRPPGR
jgi:excisionase family DNA binding protein